MACFYYNVTIDPTDLTASDDGFVYIGYFLCPGGSPSTRTYNVAGNYFDDYCNDDAAGTPNIYILVGGLPQVPLSTTTSSGNPCDVTPTPTSSETPTPTPTQTTFLTPTPTITLTPSTTPPFSPFISSGYFGTTTDIACAGSLSGISVIFTADTNNFCTATSLTGNTFASQTTGNYYLVESGQIIQISLTQFSNIVSVISVGCTTCPTPTPTPTTTQTPTITPTVTPSSAPEIVGQFIDCDNGSIFRFAGALQALTLGSVYLITGSTEFEGCATFTADTNTGPLFDADGVTFIEILDCAETVCPRVAKRAALLLKCGSGTVFYANVDEDTAFIGATYIYDGICYYFEEFSGPGGPYAIGPISDNCETCYPTPTPAVSPTPTPTNATFFTCVNVNYCLQTGLDILSGLTGNYTWYGGYYNCYPYYEGGGTEYGIIFFNGTSWCLSTYLGGPCIIRGGYPCLSTCPDLDENVFTVGFCPPPPTPVFNCDIIDFNAYFDCKVTPTPSVGIACDVVGFSLSAITVTPTPTPTPQYCTGTSINFSLSAYTPSTDVTPTPTPSITPTLPVTFSGSATFEVLQQQFICASVKVLLDESTNIEYYTSDQLIFNNTPIVTGITISALINGSYLCVTYVRDDSNFSSNSTVEQIFAIYGSYASCSNIPSPTPTTTTTPTPSITPTITLTSTVTPTISQTPTNTATPGLSPTPTNTITPSITPTNTMTPSITPSVTQSPTLVYVYESCQPLQFVPYLNNQIIQTQKVLGVELGNSFKDSLGNCWTYLGPFSSNYTAPINVLPTNWTGNYFTTIGSLIYSNCNECINGIPTTNSQITINNDGVTVGQPDLCGGYQKSDTTLRVTNYNLDGIEVVTLVDIVVEISLEVNDCIGVNYETIFITLPAGLSTTTQSFVSNNFEDCPLTGQCATVTRTVYSVVSISPSTITKSPSSQY